MHDGRCENNKNKLTTDRLLGIYSGQCQHLVEDESQTNREQTAKNLDLNSVQLFE